MGGEGLIAVSEVLHLRLGDGGGGILVVVPGEHDAPGVLLAAELLIEILLDFLADLVGWDAVVEVDDERGGEAVVDGVKVVVGDAALNLALLHGGAVDRQRVGLGVFPLDVEDGVVVALLLLIAQGGPLLRGDMYEGRVLHYLALACVPVLGVVEDGIVLVGAEEVNIAVVDLHDFTQAVADDLEGEAAVGLQVAGDALHLGDDGVAPGVHDSWGVGCVRQLGDGDVVADDEVYGAVDDGAEGRGLLAELKQVVGVAVTLAPLHPAAPVLGLLGRGDDVGLDVGVNGCEADPQGGFVILHIACIVFLCCTRPRRPERLLPA